MISIALLGALGAYLGILSKRNIILAGLRMAFFAAVVSGIVYLIQVLLVSI